MLTCLYVCQILKIFLQISGREAVSLFFCYHSGFPLPLSIHSAPAPLPPSAMGQKGGRKVALSGTETSDLLFPDQKQVKAPSMTMSLPVQKGLVSPASQTTMDSSSSGWPRRPIGPIAFHFSISGFRFGSLMIRSVPI